MYRVMIIDDEPWVLARLQGICDWESMGFELIAAESRPAHAWLSIRKLCPDVVFLDINMPGFSGLKLLRSAREQGMECEFIIISGYDDFTYAQKAIENGVFHYFLKPVDSREFSSVLNKLKGRLDTKAASPAKDPPLYPHTDSACLNSILDYIHRSYTQQFGLADLSKEFYISQTYICDLFSKYINTTFIKYLNGVRLEAAEKLLTGTDIPVSQVALESGFRDYSYFSKLYKRKYGLTPSEYRSRADRGTEQ